MPSARPTGTNQGEDGHQGEPPGRALGSDVRAPGATVERRQRGGSKVDVQAVAVVVVACSTIAPSAETLSTRVGCAPSMPDSPASSSAQALPRMPPEVVLPQTTWVNRTPCPPPPERSRASVGSGL